MAAGAALAAKRGEGSRATLKGASRQMARSMSEKQLKDFPKTKRKKLPAKKVTNIQSKFTLPRDGANKSPTHSPATLEPS
jgi:Protein of unknwon function (DUF3008)